MKDPTANHAIARVSSSSPKSSTRDAMHKLAPEAEFDVMRLFQVIDAEEQKKQ
jgi:hypothetical protein